VPGSTLLDRYYPGGIASDAVAYELKLGQLAAEMEYGTVMRWLKREGEAVTQGEPLVEVEAEKANHEIEAPVSGRIESILAEEGDEIKVGAVMALIDEDG
jgi:pyruvate/2-oxoglutarate dehydrogenase complex dihydrolipoamide acyltransferase (E2) component